MLKVLHLLNYPGQGGSEKYILSLAEKLHNKNCIFYLGYSLEGPLLEQMVAMGIRTFPLPMKNPYDLRAAKNLGRLCKELSIDIIHTHFLRENYISIFSKLMNRRIGLVNTVHLSDPKGTVLKLSNKVLTTFDDRIIAVCHAGKRQMKEEGISLKKVKVIHNGVDVDYWGQDHPPSTLRSELGIGENDFVITSVGRFTQEKGHAFFIRCIKRFLEIQDSNTTPPLKFVLVGDGDLLRECKELASSLNIQDQMIFTGYRTDIRNVLKGSDLYVSPSQSEALSISIIEALASGLPVVATDVGGTSEIINPQNDCGILVQYGDEESLAHAMSKLFKDTAHYTRSKRNAYTTAKNNFSLDSMAHQTYNLYKEICI